MLRKFLGESGVVRKDFSVAFILLFNTFAWFYMTLTIIDSALRGLSVTDAKPVIWGAYYVAIVGSSIAGSIVSSKIGRLKILYFWMIFGVVMSSFLVPLSNFTVTPFLIVCVTLGISFGFGMPSCLAYFADSTFTENRGRIGGIILLTTNLCAPLFATVFNMSSLGVNSLILAIWRGSGLIIFFLGPKEKMFQESRRISLLSRFLIINPFFSTLLLGFCFVL